MKLHPKHFFDQNLLLNPGIVPGPFHFSACCFLTVDGVSPRGRGDHAGVILKAGGDGPL